MILRAFPVLLGVFLIGGCTTIQSTYIPTVTTNLPVKKPSEVEFLGSVPTKSTSIIGRLAVGGGASTSPNAIIEEAKAKAAAVGGDFIVIVKAGADERTVLTPGYSSFSSTGNAFGQAYATGNTATAFASASANSQGYSVGPSINTVSLPWANFLVGIYPGSRLGLVKDHSITGRFVIRAFSTNSKANQEGLELGDEVVSINNIDAHSPAATLQFKTIPVGQKVEVSFLRNGTQRQVMVEAVSN